ncbi:MAG: hypothetical protein H6702_15290 [Myxococcales bacterium]|nr:hypothetical protein [Myxococcales bacterium]
MNTLRPWGIAVGLVGLVGCADDARPRTFEIEPGEGRPDAALHPDAQAADAAPDAAPVDAAAPDLAIATDAGPAECRVQVRRVGDDGQVGAATDCQVAPAMASPCEALAQCLCALVPEVEPEQCHWAVAEPRALENLSDWCNGARSVADLLSRESWLMSAPAKFELSASLGCADTVASF